MFTSRFSRMIRESYDLIERCGQLHAANRQVQERASHLLPSAPVISRRLIRGPIVPPVRRDELPPDIVWPEHTCDKCGACWQTGRSDVRQIAYNESYFYTDAQWILYMHCPVCNGQYYRREDRFQPLPTESRRKRRGKSERVWYTDRMTGRVVTYGASGWEEAE
jgi:hypothetical protein